MAPLAVWNRVSSVNPAWICMNVLTSPVYNDDGTVARYDGFQPSRIDVAMFWEWAEHCRQQVTFTMDGTQVIEPRCTFNGGFDSETTRWEAAQQVASIGRAKLFWKGTTITVAIDRRQSVPTQLFTVGNIGNDGFKETFLPFADRATEIEAQFANKAKDYTRDQFIIAGPSSDAVTKKATVQLLGITRLTEAYRMARLSLYKNLYIGRMIEIPVDIDALAATLGDLIMVQHDVPMWGGGGLIVSATSTTVTLDKTVTIAAGKAYEITIRFSTDAVVTRKVITAAGDHATLTVATPFSAVPAEFSPYAFGESSMQAKPFVITGLSRTGDQQITITAAEYNDSIYNIDSDAAVLPTINYSTGDPLPSVTGLALNELLLAGKDGGLNDVIDVTWTRPTSPHYRSAEVWVDGGGGWAFAGATPDAFFRINNVLANRTYTIMVLTVNSLGQKTPRGLAPSATVMTLGKLKPPSYVGSFAVCVSGNQLAFTWEHIPDADLWAYEIRRGASWDAATVVADGVTMNSHLAYPDATGNVTYLIKAIDTSGIYSVNANAVTINIIGPSVSGITANVIDNNVLLKWVGTVGTFPINFYRIKRGAAWAGGELVGEIAGTFAPIFETVSGTYKYWIAAVDHAGIEGVAQSISASVNQPPDYVLKDEFNDEFSGTLTNIALDGATGKHICPVNTTETWEGHFVNNSKTTMQGFIDAGYSIYVQPVPASATYEDTYDLGSVISAGFITATLDSAAVLGTVAISPEVSVSPDNATWVTGGVGNWKMLGTGFRYIKVVITFTPAGQGILQLNKHRVCVDVKEMTDSGRATIATAANGIRVDFNKSFADVRAQIATAVGAAARYAICDFIDYKSTTTAGSDTTHVHLKTGEGAYYRVNDWVRVDVGGIPERVQVTGIASDILTVTALSVAPPANVAVYPQSMIVYLYDNTGTKITGEISWMVRGV